MNKSLASEYLEDLKKNPIKDFNAKSVLGFGSSAAVFLAENNNGEKFAIKVFDEELIKKYGREKQLARIKRELGLIDKYHKHLIKIFDGGICPITNKLYLVMEYLNADSLADVLVNIPRENIKLLISQVSSAARFLESHNIVHRDIKPQNIVVNKNYNHATLLDLGIIRPIASSDLTDNSEETPFLGTKRYAPPEFLLRKEDKSTDGWRAITYYQLGSVLHDLIMKKPLFWECSSPEAALIEAVINNTPTIVSDEVDIQVKTLASNCLVKDPKLRCELINWDSFDITETDTSLTVEQAEDRINKRIKRMQKEIKVKQPMEVSVKNFLNEIQYEIREIFRNFIIQDSHFPPVTADLITYQDDSPLIFMKFKKNELCCLKNGMTIIIKIQINNAKERIVTIANACINAETDEVPENKYFVVQYKGKFDLNEISKTTSKLYLLLDECQAASLNDDPMYKLTWLYLDK